MTANTAAMSEELSYVRVACQAYSYSHCSPADILKIPAIEANRHIGVDLCLWAFVVTEATHGTSRRCVWPNSKSLMKSRIGNQ